jgi:hypothetical protein
MLPTLAPGPALLLSSPDAAFGLMASAGPGAVAGTGTQTGHDAALDVTAADLMAGGPITSPSDGFIPGGDGALVPAGVSSGSNPTGSWIPFISANSPGSRSDRSTFSLQSGTTVGEVGVASTGATDTFFAMLAD